MRRFLLINVLSLFIGYGMSQTATIAGDFSQGLRCVEPGVQSAMLELRNASSNSAGVTGIKWEVKDAVTGTIIHTQTYPSNFSPYTAIISQAGTYWAVMTVWWANVERMDSMKFVVHSMPQFSFAKNTDSICPGEGITFNYSMASPFTQGMVKSVVWDFGDGGTSTQNAPTYNYLNGQNREVSYPVSLTVTDTNQCASRLEYSNFVFVRTKPRTGFAADNAYFCFGGATAPEGKPVFTNYTDTGIAGVNNTYRWSFGDGTTSTSEHETHTYMPGVYPVTLVATSQHGCVDSVVKSNYIRVVKLTPVFTLEDTVICSLPDTIYPIGRNGNSVEYDWEIDNIMNGRPILREPTFIFRKQDVGTHTLRYTIIDKTGDGSCSVDTFVTLHLFDKIPSEITATDTNECDPDHVITFNNTTSYPWPDDFGKAQTNWDFYDGTTGTGHTTTHTYGVSAVPDDIYAYPDGGYGNYRVKMTGTTPYGCPLEPVYQYIHIFRMHAVGTVIDPAPPDPPHGCVPHTVTLANIPDSLISSSEIISYVWRWNFDETGTNPNADPKDTTLGSISGEEPHTYEDTGRYNVYLTLTNKQGCVHDIFVKYIMVGDTVLVDFKFEPDTNCKDLISIKVTAYDSLNSDGSLAGDAWADGWTWLDENDTPIGGPTDTTEVHPQNPGPVTIKLQASHLGCNSYFVPVVSGVDVGIVCPPVATIKDPHDDPPGQHPVYCGFETIPFISDSKGAIYQRWYAGDYYPYVPKDTVRQSKGPLIKWDATLGDYIQYDANGDSVGTGADWEFLYSDSSATDYLMKLNGVITLSLWAMNDSSVTDDPSDPMFNLCGYCDNWAEQIILISHARMNFTVSDDALCQGDSVRFYDSTQSSVGLFGWGFKFDSAWNTSYIEDYITIGKIIPQENYMPDPKYGHGYWLPFSKPNKYRVVLEDTCVFGCIRNDTLELSVLPRSVPNFTSSLDGVNYRYKREPNSDTLCINSGGQYYLRDSSWSPHPYENAQIIGWDWRVGNARDSVQHPTLTVTTAGYHDLYLTVKNEYGCDSTHNFQYQLLANRVMAEFSTPRKSVCNKTEVAFTNLTTVLPASNNRNTLLELKYYWGDGDSSIIYAKSQEQTVIGHTYDLPNLDNPVTIILKATIVDPVTHASLGCEAEYRDSIVVSRPIALFTDDGHEFPCPDNTSGVKGRTIRFTEEALGVLGPNSILEWNFGDTASDSRNSRVGPYPDPDTKSPIHRYDNAGIYDVLLIVQDENRCRDSLLKEGYVRILGARGSFTYTEEASNCKPSQVTFIPSVEQDQSFLPDSLAIHTGTGEITVNRGDYYGLTRTRRIVYNEAGAYSPIYFLYKTVDFQGTKETCIIQIMEEDTIYVIDLQPNFETESLYCPDSVNPVIFKNTSTWIPAYLRDSMVSITWDMGNGDSSQTYYDTAYKDESLNGKTYYATSGIYPVTLTMQVSNCIQKKMIEIEVMEIPEVSLVPDTAIACDGLEAEFRVESLTDVDISRITSYEWVFEDTTITGNPALREFKLSGEYPYTLTLTFLPSGCSKVYYDTVTVFAYKSPVAAIEADPEVGEVDQEFRFTDKTTQGDGNLEKWFWNFGDGNTSPDSSQSEVFHPYSNTSGYVSVTLYVEDEFGCRSTAEIQIIVTEKLAFPNIFTPGGNCPPAGKKQNNICEFRPLEDKGYFQDFKMEIYDKWGMLVWSRYCTDPNCPDYDGDGFWWKGTNKQGKQVADGVYYWTLYARPLSGTDPFIKNGSITVVSGQK